MIIAWLGCVAASLSAAWLAPIEASFDDLWPALAGAALAVLGAWRGAPWRRWRVPPGDLLLPAAALGRLALEGVAAADAALGRKAARSLEALRRRWDALAGRWGELAAAGEARLGPAASLLVLALIALLASS